MIIKNTTKKEERGGERVNDFVKSTIAAWKYSFSYFQFIVDVMMEVKLLYLSD